ncbi:MAG: cytochrome P450 [Limisphaerales bacterium]|jgi:cytochrome P450
MSDVATCPLHDINPMLPQNLASPWIMNQRLRDEAPVFQDPNSGIFFISRYADVVAMARDHQTFSSVMLAGGGRAVNSDDAEVLEIMAQGYPNVATMLTQDPPLQRRYRKFVDSAFGPANLKKLEPYITEISNQLIDNFQDKGECEFLSEFGVPLPLNIIASQIGVPLTDLPKLRVWTGAFIGNLSQQLSPEGIKQAARDILEFQLYFVERMEERRAKPTDDILSMIVNATIDDEPLNNAEGLSMLSQILVAGNETTAGSLTEGIWLLINHPDQYELLLSDTSPQMISNFVEEVLRISSPSSNMFRRTTQDVEMHGVTIPENSICFARFASANQDESQFQDASKFDITRTNLKDHVAFGKGIHHCLGAALARREMNGGFTVIFERLKNFRLADGADEPKFAPNALLHGLASLPIAFDVK